MDASPPSTSCRPAVIKASILSSVLVISLMISLYFTGVFYDRAEGSVSPAIIRKGATAAVSCLGRCGDKESSAYSCQCNSACLKFNDCCNDYNRYCVEGSCLNRCDDTDIRYPCTCDSQCGSWPVAGCCSDHDARCKIVVTTTAPGSCTGRCGQIPDSTQPCQCNSKCSKFGDCCSDYASLCGAPAPPPTSAPVPVDISAFASAIWADDVNRLTIGSDLVMNTGNYISDSYLHQDVSYNRLFSSVNAQMLQRPTYKALIKLFNNYITTQGQTETKTSTESAEEDEFINAIFNTVIMQRAYQFVKAKNYYSGSLSQYKTFIRGLLFTHYSRKATRDSSGFEHVFVGEFSDSSTISGFHNWVRMYLLEDQGHANYYGYIKQKQPNLIKYQFKWSNRVKPVTSTMYGVSPEFEIALFSTCFLKSPNSLCRLKINGQTANVQTYDYKGAQVFGSAYFTS
ncbi:uridylate-specific endoribonuclease-like isoform X1 [Asterias amurensis]|uniref:uridylate-specific endoribonuclease-like isoform X1 n=1 Tax=Asterias amurensis TaxID=7602 RepID=UPI003AB8B259